MTPASSLASAVISGSVSVSNFPATQPISGAVSVSNFPATQPVSGSVSVSGTVTANQGTAGTAWPVDASSVPVPVTGPLTNTQLRAAAVNVDGSAVTQPVSADSLPLPDGATRETTLTTAARSLNDIGLTAILARDTLAA